MSRGVACRRAASRGVACRVSRDTSHESRATCHASRRGSLRRVTLSRDGIPTQSRTTVVPVHESTKCPTFVLSCGVATTGRRLALHIPPENEHCI
ncbi:unnamed protein product [Colias eurytheme]|nr:unnamed protein product [Colias eurytheme]